MNVVQRGYSKNVLESLWSIAVLMCGCEDLDSLFMIYLIWIWMGVVLYWASGVWCELDVFGLDWEEGGVVPSLNLFIALYVCMWSDFANGDYIIGCEGYVHDIFLWDIFLEREWEYEVEFWICWIEIVRVKINLVLLNHKIVISMISLMAMSYALRLVLLQGACMPCPASPFLREQSVKKVYVLFWFFWVGN